jgi:DNA-binding NarL/FixJ family response regulator
MGRLAEARRLADANRGTTRAIEANVLGLCIYAVVALKARDPHLTQALRDLVSNAYAAGAVDLIVTAYRGSPELLAALLRDSEIAEVAGYVVARASDQPLAASMGLDMLQAIDPVFALSPREREIYALLCEGLSNSDIAQRLFISPETVKVHVRHVFDKLGIRSRTALALHAASRRAQAAPAASATNSGSSLTDG